MATPPIHISHALNILAGAVPQGAKVWSHGKDFDLVILAGYYRRNSRREPYLECPWKHYDTLDTRTLFDLAGRYAGWQRPRRETAHVAMQDALDQARDVIEAHAALGQAT